jgi:hypothetical protein
MRERVFHSDREQSAQRVVLRGQILMDLFTMGRYFSSFLLIFQSELVFLRAQFQSWERRAVKGTVE